MNSHTGSCHCGSVKFRATSAPHHVGYCHCGDCRRASGALLSAFIGFRVEDIRFEGRLPATYAGAPVKRSFCATCGTPIVYVDERPGDQVFFKLGVMDAPQNDPPKVHGYVRKERPTFHCNDNLPRIETDTAPRRQELIA